MDFLVPSASTQTSTYGVFGLRPIYGVESEEKW